MNPILLLLLFFLSLFLALLLSIPFTANYPGCVRRAALATVVIVSSPRLFVLQFTTTTFLFLLHSDFLLLTLN